MFINGSTHHVYQRPASVSDSKKDKKAERDQDHEQAVNIKAEETKKHDRKEIPHGLKKNAERGQLPAQSNPYYDSLKLIAADQQKKAPEASPDQPAVTDQQAQPKQDVHQIVNQIIDLLQTAIQQKKAANAQQNPTGGATSASDAAPIAQQIVSLIQKVIQDKSGVTAHVISTSSPTSSTGQAITSVAATNEPGQQGSSTQK